MNVLLDRSLSLLDWLIAHDTTNPPRRPEALVDRLARELGAHGLAVTVEDHGDGAVSVMGTRGAARTLLTAHVDTVPVAPDWTLDPFALTVRDGRAYGLGSTDIKGGAAAMMAAAFATDAPCALLFTTDEEAGQATCMRRFAERAAGAYELCVVAEPTHGRAVYAHRGVGTGLLRFEGRAAHSSLATSKSALHDMVEWGVRALELARRLDDEAGPAASEVRGMRFNLGKVVGGEKSNVVAARAEARFGLRPPPGIDPVEAVHRFAALAPEAAFEVAFHGPSLPASLELADRARAWLAPLAVPEAPPVDFWTEASILSAAGLPAVVLGPGDIGLAHGPDEYVELEELGLAAESYLRILEGGAAR